MALQRDTLSEKLDRVQKSIQQFPVVASSLNTATDQLGKSVGQLDAILKKFSLGIPTWVPFTPPNELHFPRYYHEDIGYAKIGGKWGIAIRTVDGHEGSDLADVEQWLFPEAPRLLRVQSVEKIPELLEELIAHALQMSKRIAERAEEVDFFTAGINSVINPLAQPRITQRDSAHFNSFAEEFQRASTSTTAVLSDPTLTATIEEFNRANAISSVLGFDTAEIANAASVTGVPDGITAASVMGVAVADAVANAEAILGNVTVTASPKSYSPKSYSPKSYASAKARK